MQIVDWKLDNNEKFKALEGLLGWIYVMAYFDLASNPGSKPQSFSDTNCQNCTWKQNTYFLFCFQVQHLQEKSLNL